jgi:hypothetical protein
MTDAVLLSVGTLGALVVSASKVTLEGLTRRCSGISISSGVKEAVRSSRSLALSLRVRRPPLQRLFQFFGVLLFRISLVVESRLVGQCRPP